MARWLVAVRVIRLNSVHALVALWQCLWCGVLGCLVVWLIPASHYLRTVIPLLEQLILLRGILWNPVRILNPRPLCRSLELLRCLLCGIRWNPVRVLKEPPQCRSLPVLLCLLSGTQLNLIQAPPPCRWLAVFLYLARGVQSN